MNYLIKNYSKHCAAFETRLNELKSGTDTETIHQLRRNIKRIRIYYKFLSGFSPENFNAGMHYAVMKDLFKKAGEIREIQLNLKIIDSWELPGAAAARYKRYLNSNFRRLRRELKRIVKGFDIVAFDHSKEFLVKNFSDLDNNDIRNESIHCIMTQCRKISRLLSRKYTPQNIHEIRKRFKYLYVMFQLLNSLKKMKQLEKVVVLLKKTEEKEGEWHDRVVLIYSIENFLKANPRIANTVLKPIKELLDKLKSENAEMVVDIISRINFALMNIKY